jgi:hypothetical protein
MESGTVERREIRCDDPMRQYLPLFILFLAIGIAIFPVSGTVTVNAASINGTTDCVNFTGTSSHTYNWFEYGIDQTGNPFSEGGYKSFATPPSSGNFAFRQCGLPFVSGQKYVVQAAGADDLNYTNIEYSDNASFIMPVVTPHVTTTYSQQANQFINDMQDNPTNIVTVDMWLPYTVIFGADIFWGLIIGLTFFNMATKQRTTAMAVLVLFLTGTTIFAIFPPEFTEFAEILFVIAIGGMFYWWIIRRR